MTLADRIKTAQDELIVLKDSLVEVTKELEDTPDDEDLGVKLEDLTGQVEKKTQGLDRLERAEKALAEKVAQKTAEQTGGPALIHSTKKKDNTPLWLKQAVVEFVAHNTRQPKDQVIEDRYPEDRALKAVTGSVEKTAVPIATTFTSGWASQLVQEDVRGFLDVLTPLSAAAALATRSLVLNFDGYDTVKVPMRAARSTGRELGGSWIGEGGAIPLGKLTVSSMTLSRYKMGEITPRLAA
jgi:HK97 family phage major capsid protein